MRNPNEIKNILTNIKQNNLAKELRNLFEVGKVFVFSFGTFGIFGTFYEA